MWGHSRHVKVFLHGTHLWIERVSSEDNISDLPSRTEYALMESLGAKWRKPMLSHVFLTDYLEDAQWRQPPECKKQKVE